MINNLISQLVFQTDDYEGVREFKGSTKRRVETQLRPTTASGVLHRRVINSFSR